ncbi:rap guanine nucleotide exchange factor 1-like, partial [Seriola lalandi dorsalis]|uniref:rap guanine nucleotide exchange factor 1-like n=1 Tax=Seriola lalandi dorsalis TaxID=1841481 RepID=UPI000C6F82CA
TLHHKSRCVLEDQQRAVVTSLHYFKALVDRLGLDRPGVDKLVLDQSVVGGLLGGASGGVLEAVQILVQLEPHLHKSKTISACLNRLYRSLAQLIQWADRVMLQGVAHDDKESTVSVTTVMRAVLDGVKDLVRLAAEREEGSAPLSPVQSQPAMGQMGGFDEQETSDRMSTCRSPAQEEDGGEETVSAPPKPLMPLPQVPPPQGLSPPALPPKKRQSLPGPASCRVAIVAPMRREPEVETQVQEEEEGPDVKAASPDILVVYATETDISTERVLYCEAFLSTYRTFIRPDDVISKLQHRYKHLCEGREPEHLKAAKNTFHLLVRVVDEL